MNCKDCLFSKQETYAREGLLLCMKSSYVGDIDMYTKATTPFDDTLAYPSDYEEHQAELFVGSNFGCIHFKPKDFILENLQTTLNI